jgi:hypothetical protein
MADTPKAADWAAEYKRLSETSRQLSIPAETLVRLFKGDYVPGMPEVYDGMRALDVSCGARNNGFFALRSRLGGVRD